MKKARIFNTVVVMLTISLLAGCASNKGLEANYPKSKDQLEQDRIGKLTGEDGITLFGKSRRTPGSNGIGVNSYLWRATLDTVYTMPLVSADPFGGVIITDWYQLAGNANERFKLNIVIVGSELRADGVRVSAFKQIKRGNVWEEAKVTPALGKEVEDKILNHARSMRFHQGS